MNLFSIGQGKNKNRSYMKYIMLTLLFAGGLIAGLVAVVVAQGIDDTSNSHIGQIRPLLVNVHRQIPVSLTLAVPIDSSRQTVTIPLNLNLGLTLGIENDLLVAFETSPSEPAVISIADLPPASIPTARSDVAILTDINGEAYEVGKLRVQYTSSSSKYIEFSFLLETGQVTRTVQDKIKLDDLRRLSFIGQMLELHLVDGSTISLSPETYMELDASGNLVESGKVFNLTFAAAQPQQTLVGFEGSVTTALGLKSSLVIPLEGVSSIEFEVGQPVGPQRVNDIPQP